MSRKDDLEGHIRQSYAIVTDYERLLQLSERPEEKLRADHHIAQQWRLIRTYLEEYQALCRHFELPLSSDLKELVQHFPDLAAQFMPDALRAERDDSLISDLGWHEWRVQRLLAKLDKQHSRYLEALTLQTRMQDNQTAARVYGDTEILRHDRAQIIQALNTLSLEVFGMNLVELAQSS